MKKDKPIYTFDTETDPFVYGREPKVFACGLYDGEKFWSTWGDDCLQKMRVIVANLPPGIVYAHNGGRFDFYFMLDWFEGEMNIINSRIIRAYGQGHEWRDSAAIYPMPLKNFKKDAIDYTKMEAATRNEYRAEILSYLESDCSYLHELVSEFRNEFGNNLTIGGTSMKQLKKLHKFDVLSAEQDIRIREKYYYGGRVECFEKGIITPKDADFLQCYDINQSYPTSMRNYKHPIGEPIFDRKEITQNTYFVTVYGYSYGCFPKRSNDGELSFPVAKDVFSVTIHEYKSALEIGMFEPYDVIECIDFEKTSTFDEFVDKFHGLRKQAQLNSDKLHSDLYKLVCNTPYGKLAQSSDNYYDYVIRTDGIVPDGWEPCYVMGDIILSRKKSEDVTRYNVATGASITGCSRSFLIRALASCKRPLYCDTDSIICEGMSEDTLIDPTKLGAWKLEKIADRAAIAGKKLYALFEGTKCVKMASKGVRLSPEQIVNVASGGKVTWFKDAPTFNLKGGVRFMHRDVKMT